VQLRGGKALLPHTGGYVDSNGLGHFATGGGYGMFQGPGSGTSDSIPAMVSNGEYINTAATVSRLGVDFFQKLNRGWSPAPAANFASTSGSSAVAGDVNFNVSTSDPLAAANYALRRLNQARA
jgi:hypothetical protein